MGTTVKSKVDCAEFKRLPCADQTVTRAALVYRDGARVFVAAVPALSDAEQASIFSETLSGVEGDISLSFVGSEFAANLDVYEVTNQEDLLKLAKQAELQFRNTFDPEVANELRITSSTGDREVMVVSTASDRTFIPFLKSPLEILDFYERPVGDWSGTSVYDPTDGALVGLIGDEFLQMRAGKPTRLIRYEDDASAKVNHAVVIPEHFVRTETARIVAGGAPAIRRVDSSCYLAQGIRTCEVCDVSQEDEAPSNPNFPIGGANGTGVGGLLASGKRCKMRFTRENHGFTDLPATGKAWFTELSALDDLSPVEAWYTVDSQKAVWILGGASEFFRVVIDSSQAIPRLYVKPSKDWNAAEAALYGSAERVAQLAFDRLESQFGPSGEEIFAFIAQVYTQARLLQSDRRDLAPYQVLEAIRDGRETEWGLIEWGSDAGVNLHTEFVKLVDLRKSVP